MYNFNFVKLIYRKDHSLLQVNQELIYHGLFWLPDVIKMIFEWKHHKKIYFLNTK